MSESPGKEKILCQEINTAKIKLNVLKNAIKQERASNSKLIEEQKALSSKISNLEETITEKDKMLNKIYKDYQNIKELLDTEKARNEALLKSTSNDEDTAQIFKYISYTEAEKFEIDLKRLKGENEYLKAQLEAIRIKSHEQGEYIVKQKEELLTQKNQYINQITRQETLLIRLQSDVDVFKTKESDLRAENVQYSLKCEYMDD